jgi:hypothetical protein
MQWDGTNVTTVRQFVRANAAMFNYAAMSVDANNVLTLPLNTNPNSPVIVNLNDWLVHHGNDIEVWNPTDFASRYVVDP